MTLPAPAHPSRDTFALIVLGSIQVGRNNEPPNGHPVCSIPDQAPPGQHSIVPLDGRYPNYIYADDAFRCSEPFASKQLADDYCLGANLCTYLHDWNCDGLNWRVCSGQVSYNTVVNQLRDDANEAACMAARFVTAR